VATSLAIATILTTAANGYAQAVFGNWESGTREGWIDWNTGTPTAVVEPPKFVFNSIGATLGTGAIQYNSPGGYTQWLAIKLQNDINDPLSNQIADYRPGFLEHTKLAFDITLDAAEQTVGNDFVNMGLFVNSNTWGFMRIGDPNNDNVPESVTPFTGFNGGKAFNPSQLVGVQTSTWTYDISFLHDGNAENGEIVEGDYIELIFEQFSNGPYVLHIDNVRFFTPVVLTADFVDDNVIDGQDFSAWKGGFGLSGQPHANGDATGEGVVNGEDFLHWQREFGATEGNALSSLGAVPEPHALLLGAVVIAAASVCRGRFSVRQGTRSRPALYKSQGVKRG
jgi:hypothetical protein